MDCLNLNFNFNIIRYGYMSQNVRLPVFLYAAVRSGNTSSLNYVGAGFDVCK
jgi:hypothetical protein